MYVFKDIPDVKVKYRIIQWDSLHHERIVFLEENHVCVLLHNIFFFLSLVPKRLPLYSLLSTYNVKIHFEWTGNIINFRILSLKIYQQYKLQNIHTWTKLKIMVNSVTFLPLFCGWLAFSMSFYVFSCQCFLRLCSPEGLGPYLNNSLCTYPKIAQCKISTLEFFLMRKQSCV